MTSKLSFKSEFYCLYEVAAGAIMKLHPWLSGIVTFVMGVISSDYPHQIDRRGVRITYEIVNYV